MKKLVTVVLIAYMMAGCAAPQRVAVQPTSTPASGRTNARVSADATPGTGAPVPGAPTATRARQERSTPTATAAVAASPTAAATPVAPAATLPPSPTAAATPVALATAIAQTGTSGASVPRYVAQPAGVQLGLNPRKYAAPTLLTPDNNATYHVSQPVAHLAWSPTPTDLLTFGQMPGCVSDAIIFRRAFESYQLVIHSLDGKMADRVQWNDNNPSFDLNLTTVPPGRYSWSASVVALCESYVVGQRNDTNTHKSTLQRAYLGAVSPTSTARTINWVP